MVAEAHTIRAARAGEAALLSELAVRSKAHWGYSHEFIEAFPSVGWASACTRHVAHQTVAPKTLSSWKRTSSPSVRCPAPGANFMMTPFHQPSAKGCRFPTITSEPGRVSKVTECAEPSSSAVEPVQAVSKPFRILTGLSLRRRRCQTMLRTSIAVQANAALQPCEGFRALVASA
jgi:hypothetical protein